MNSRYIELLQRIGLTYYEARAYVALTILGEGSIRDISQVSKVPTPKLYEVLSRLEEKGFIISIQGRPLKYVPREPKEVLSNIKAEYEMIINELIDGLGEIWKTRKKLSRIILVRDVNDIVRKIRSILNDATNSVKIIIDECSLWIEYGLIENLKNLLDRGVDIRILISNKCRDAGEFNRLFNDRMRFSEKANFICILRDGYEVLKGVTGNEPIVIIYNIKEIVELIDHLFNLIWEESSGESPI